VLQNTRRNAKIENVATDPQAKLTDYKSCESSYRLLSSTFIIESG